MLAYLRQTDFDGSLPSLPSPPLQFPKALPSLPHTVFRYSFPGKVGKAVGEGSI